MKEKEYSPSYNKNPDYDYLTASSVQDCTGAVPRPPQTDAELEAYLDVYPFLPKCVTGDNKKKDND